MLLHLKHFYRPGSRSTSRTPGSQLKPPSTTPIRPNTAPSNKRTPKLTSVNVSSSRSKLPATTQLKSPSSRRTGATKSTTTTPKCIFTCVYEYLSGLHCIGEFTFQLLKFSRSSSGIYNWFCQAQGKISLCSQGDQTCFRTSQTCSSTSNYRE